MNFRSVRFRLIFLYSSVLVFSLVVLLVVFYWVTKRELYNHTDSALLTHGNRIINILTQEKLLADRQMSSQLLAEVFAETPGMLVFVADNQGRLLMASQNFVSNDQIVSQLFPFVKNSRDPVYINKRVGSLETRFILLPIARNGSLQDVVMVGHPIEIIDQSLISIYGSLALIFVLFVIPTVTGGYLLAGQALKPISQISQQMSRINSENLQDRVRSPKTHDEIESLAQTFNGLLDRLAAAFTRERQFIGDVAHELKTPLAALSGTLELAKDKKHTPTYRQILDELRVDADRLNQTLANILDLAWSRSDDYAKSQDRTNLSLIMGELEEIAQKLVFGKNISVKSNIEADVFVLGKKDKLFRALLNLIENAVKYSKPRGVISCSLRADPRQAIVTIRDQGVGIAKSELPRIFDRYYRGTKTAQTLGSGLGLSISSAVIAACGGKISVKSTVGKGSEFVVIFPRMHSTS